MKDDVFSFKYSTLLIQKSST